LTTTASGKHDREMCRNVQSKPARRMAKAAAPKLVALIQGMLILMSCLKRQLAVQLSQHTWCKLQGA